MSHGPGIVRQLGHPRGLGGRLLLHMLNWSNAGMNRLALRALQAGANDRVLEIGFGGGDLIKRLLAQAAPPHVTGLEQSATAVAAGRRRFRRAIDAGAVDLQQGDAAAMPFADDAFNRVCAVNVIYFWPDTAAVLRECRRVLSPRGRLVLCYNEMPPDGANRYRPADMEAQLEAAGFADMTTESASDRANGDYFCTVVVRP